MRFKNGFNRFFARSSILALLILVAACGQRVDTTQLELEIASVRADLELAEKDLNQYSGGALHTLSLIQVKILQNTLHMLEQKRRAALNGIVIQYDYKDGVQAPLSYDPDELEGELAEVLSGYNSAKTTADMYTGGLLRTIAMTEAATHQVTIASLNQRKTLDKWGIPLLDYRALSENGLRQGEQSKVVVTDEEAL